MSAPKEGSVVHHRAALRLLHLTKVFVIIGGVIFLAMVAMSVISIVGRKIWSSPINGDMEMLKMGTGVAAAAFFPYCTMMSEHLKVEFFTARMPTWTRESLDGFANLVLALVMVALAWRTSIQSMELYETGEVTAMREIPIWIPMMLMIPSLILTSLCGLERALHHFRAGRSAR